MDDIIERADIEYKISKLSKEGQKKLIKVLIWKNLIHEFIERKTNSFANGILGIDNPSKDDIEKYRIGLVNDSAMALELLLDTIFGEDEELKFRVIQKFVDEYMELESSTKKEICRHNHNFSNWEVKVGEVPFYDEDGEIDGYIDGKEYFERTCTYCGEVQKAYSNYHMQLVEESEKHMNNNYPQKLIYDKKKVLKKDNNGQL